MTNTIEGLDLHRDDFTALFGAVTDAQQRLRSYAEPFARQVLGDEYVDNPNGWLGWVVQPAYSVSGGLVALHFTAIIYDDRSPATRKTIRVEFQ